MVKHLYAPVNEHGDVAADEENDPEEADVALAAPLVDKDLGQLHRRKRESMQCEDQVLIRNLSLTKQLEFLARLDSK